MIDNRTKVLRQVKQLTFLVVGILLGAILNEYKYYLAKPSWASQQLWIGTKSSIISPTPAFGATFVEKTSPKAQKSEKDIIIEKITAAFGSEAENALRVARCESGLNPKAKNPHSSARGLFQIMSSVHGVSERMLYDTDINIAVAKKLQKEQGWNPWVESSNCSKVH
jgi:soluble lytic murein transglycosylase-like protein